MIDYDLVPFSPDQLTVVKTMLSSEGFILFVKGIEAKVRAAQLDASNFRMEAARQENDEKRDKKLAQANMAERSALRLGTALHALQSTAEHLDLDTIQIKI